MSIDSVVTVRLDKWLWAARLFKTRSFAAEAVERGRVQINRQRVKPSRAVRVGDRIDALRGEERLELHVRELSDVRGPAPVAQRLYEETPESRERRASATETRRLAHEPARSIKGRPSKRDARELRRLGTSLPPFEDDRE